MKYIMHTRVLAVHLSHIYTVTVTFYSSDIPTERDSVFENTYFTVFFRFQKNMTFYVFFK